jgi:CheY-like chemotaxis protein
MERNFTILFVEDEATVRETVSENLTLEGFTVLLAEDGHRALRTLAERHVDLLFTDVLMPGMSGFELAFQAKLIRPDLRVLYLSGYADQANAQGGRRYGKVLQKPIRVPDLVAAIRSELET